MNISKRKFKKSIKGGDNSLLTLSKAKIYFFFSAFVLLVSSLIFQYYPHLIYGTKKSFGTEDEKESANDVTQQLTKLSKIKFTKPLQDDWIITLPFSNSSATEVVLMNVEPAPKISIVIADSVAGKKPVHIINYPNIRSNWPVFNWDLLHFAKEKNISLNGTRWKPNDPIFVLGHEREKGGMIGSRRDSPLMYANLTLFKFLKATFTPNNWLYWTGELAYMEEQLQMSATAPEKVFDVEDESSEDWKAFRVLENGLSDSSQSKNGSENSKLWTPMLWLSHPGVVAQTHYDTQHNVFIQIHGSKRFLLFPPSEELFQYPNIHRSYRQSQLHFEEVNNIAAKLASFSSLSAQSTIREGSVVPESDLTSSDSSAPSFSYPVTKGQAVAIELLLHPGDILYIPPFWQHRVESLTLALSLSILSPSRLEAAIAEIYWESVPFGEFRFSKAVRAVAARTYLSLVVAELSRQKVLNSTIGEVAKELYLTRFQLLSTAMSEKLYVCPDTEEEDGKNTVKSNKVDSEGKGNQNETKIDTETPDGAVLEGIAMIQALQQEKLPHFQEAARKLGQLFVELDVELSILLTILRDYIEQIVRWAVGPKQTGGFIYNCLA